MKILIVEGNVLLDAENLSRWAHRQHNAEVKYLYNVYNVDKKEILKLFNWCDVLAFMSTFDEEYKIMQLAKVLTNIKKSLTIYIDNPDAKDEVLQLLDNEIAYELTHHKIYQFEYYSNIHIPISLSEKAICHKRKLELEAEKKVILEEYKVSRQTAFTGRKIKIKKIIAYSKLFDKLIEGSIVDEIDNSGVDNKPNRGVWVWGNGEPVKLLKEDNIDEYDIVNSTKETVVADICKVVNMETTKEKLYLIAGILNDDEIANKENYICEVLKIPKRINRGNIRSLLINV